MSLIKTNNPLLSTGSTSRHDKKIVDWDEKLQSKFDITCLVSSSFGCPLLTSFFKKKTFSENSFRNIIRVSHGLDPDQDQRSVLSWAQSVANAISRWQKAAGQGCLCPTLQYWI